MTTVAAKVEQSTAVPHRRRVGVWAVIAIAAVVVGALGAATTAALEWSAKGALDPDGPGPTGTRALAQVLRAHGVDVEVTRDRASTDAALRSDSTLVVGSTAVLSDDALRTVTDAAAVVVLLDPVARDLRVLLDGAGTAGYAPADLVRPECDLPPAARAGSIVPGALFAATGDGVTGCYPAGEGFGLVTRDGVLAVDGRELFVNERIAEHGNAALALGLLGRSDSVVWYVPGLGDADTGSTAPTLGELTPPWVTPAIALLLCAGVVAAVWRGRRFGPLVAENLPVTVRAAETTTGRAHLYARSHDAPHALDVLRAGACDRLARLLGLGPSARPGDIADAAAARLGAPRETVRGILIDSVPASDADLVTASDRLRDLETAVRASVHLERTDP